MSTEPDAVWTDKRASKIARRIEADIVRRGWPIGASLGSESALQQRFCVSRSVLREAVRLVEHHQVARMRRGPNGGLFICEPNAGPATRAVVIYLEYLGTTIGDLLGARLVLEPLAASLAAEHIDEPGNGGRAREPRRAQQLILGAPRGKLAEVLAATIGDDIAASGWQVGSVFGTETALLERYQVSRAVLREAVRLLEYHAIAHMRRGPGGGLVVTTPQPQASIDTIALYLQYRKPSREDLRCVRDAIEIDNVAKVVKRRSEPEVASFLDTLGRPRLDNPTDDVRAAAVEEFRFHVGLARAAGNTMLDLFLLILVELFRRHLSSTEQALPTWSDVVAVGHAHVRILEAIGSGDDSLARCRTRRHLDAAASWWL